MTYVCIALAVAFIVMLTLYIQDKEDVAKQVGITEELRRELKELKDVADSAAGQRAAVSEQENLSTLDITAIEAVFEKHGWEHHSDEDKQVWFKPDDSWYLVETERLPVIRIVKGYNMTEDTDIDWEIVGQAGGIAEDKVIMSEFRYGERQFYEFYLLAVEYNVDDFDKALRVYLEILEATEREFVCAYNEIHDKKQLEEMKPENRLEKAQENLLTQKIETQIAASMKNNHTLS